MPSMNDSSDPVDTSSTRTEEVGCAASRRASSINATTPVPLSFAPGTVRVEPICANTAAEPADTTAPARRSARLPASAPAAARAGPANTGHISGGLVSLSSISDGKWRQAKAGMPGWKIRPDFAAS